MLPIGLSKLGCDNIVPEMTMQILCIMVQANLPLNASICRLPSFPIFFSQKKLIIDGTGSNNIHVMYSTQETTKLPKPLYQLSHVSI
jgi:hypothetical protein